ncbi:MAG TPA: aminotransferase class I/II-fold pyridoxal phosphate-dependent enzyme, partial [Acidobacteriaceae bacterium]|nr:aminotransferase class I/II-fold pyridoxal phosphate-dependent enzyme [Acidobacteriaceae bacterium]
MINLQSNYPVLAEQDREWNRLLHSAVDRFAPESLRLPAFGGSVENRRLAAAWLEMPVERVFIAEAGHHALIASVMAAALVGKTVAVEALTYPWFVRQVQMLGCRVVPVAMDGECMRPDALRAVCEREKVAAIYTMPTQHNPTGAVASLGRRQKVVEVAREFGLTVIEDGAYGFLVADEPPRYVELAPERAFYVESLSKRVAPGLRTAFLVAPAALAAEAELALRVTTSGSSTLLASLGCSMAADGSLAAVIQAKRVEGARRQAMALQMLAGLEIEAGENSWHMLVSLRAGMTAESCEALCEARGVLVTGVHWFT